MRWTRLLIVFATLAVLAASTGSAAATRDRTKAAVAVPLSAPAGYVIETASYTVPSGTLRYPNALCPAGTVVIGGGGSSNSTSTLVAIGSSHPQHPGNDWEMGFDNNSASDSAGTVYAICANKPKGYRIVHTIQDNPSGQLTSVVATCPRGRKGLGGGGYMGGPATTITLHDSYPSGSKQWVIHMGNGSAGDEKLVYSFEVCGEKVKGLVKVEGSPTSNPAGSQSGANVFCPGAEVPIGGGAQASSSAISVDMNSSYPISNGWHVDENNRSGSAESFTPWVVCAGT